MNLSRELLFAYVDGELSPEDSRQVAEAVAQDADLHAYIEQQRQLKARLQAAFKPIMEAPVPERLARAVNETPMGAASAPVVPFAGWARRLRERKTARTPWIPVGAMAAGLALGILLADSFGMGSDIGGQGGRVIAQGTLARALSTQLAAEQSDSRTTPTRIGLSFVSHDGTFCRSFETARNEGTVAGLACRENGLWRIAALASTPPRPTGQFQPAGAAMPAAIREAVSGMIVGDPLGAEAERAARNQGWRAR